MLMTEKLVISWMEQKCVKRMICLQADDSSVSLREDGSLGNITFYSTIPPVCAVGTYAEDCKIGVSLLVFGQGITTNEQKREGGKLL